MIALDENDRITFIINLAGKVGNVLTEKDRIIGKHGDIEKGIIDRFPEGHRWLIFGKIGRFEKSPLIKFLVADWPDVATFGNQFAPTILRRGMIVAVDFTEDIGRLFTLICRGHPVGDLFNLSVDLVIQGSQIAGIEKTVVNQILGHFAQAILFDMIAL